MAGATEGRRSDFRPDVQGLRAVAVLLVVAYHLWPNRLSGGFVGVDVFFVISGYLITRHLVEEVEREGRVRLLRFWARRARRLLPASLLVLLVSLVAVWLWLPETMWERTARQVGASALYVQNWQLAHDAVDYSALNAEATVAQHYWSLSVEEQFYLVWPVLIALLLLCAARIRGRDRLSVRPVVAGVALVGDSHATSWMPALDELGRKHGWLVRTYTKTSCPPSLAVRSVKGETDASWQANCADWIRSVDRELREATDIDTVFVASYSTAYTFSAPDDQEMAAPATDGFATLWRRWIDDGLRVVAFHDVPRTNGDNVPTCLAETDDPMDCAVPAGRALPRNRAITKAATQMRAEGVVPIGLDRQFCDDEWCFPVVGSVIVYRDYSHLSREYAVALAPFIERQLPGAQAFRRLPRTGEASSGMR